MSKVHSTWKSFGYAYSGIKTALKQEPNLRIHLVIGALALIMGIVLRLSSGEWITLTLMICFVIIMELVNTALESLVNIVSPTIKENAKTAKDVAAAAVLISACFSVIIGLFIFLPKILKLF